MRMRMRFAALGFLLAVICGCSPAAPSSDTGQAENELKPLVRTEEEWRKLLTSEEYHVLREKGTEPRFSGEYVEHKVDGVYLCRACELPLYSSQTKFESGTGWPSFWNPVSPAHVRQERDTSHGMVRTELLCARCGSHLGHVFGDGPPPTGMRHCINSISLKFEPEESSPDSAPRP